MRQEYWLDQRLRLGPNDFQKRGMDCVENRMGIVEHDVGEGSKTCADLRHQGP